MIAPFDTRLGVPALENISRAPQQSFCWNCHDFPAPIAIWNFHPEYELHLITKSEGLYFVGDYFGRFNPGNLVLIGPYIPHYWFSDLAEGKVIQERDVVLQFSSDWINALISLCLELDCVNDMLMASCRGIEFVGNNASACIEKLVALGTLEAAQRLPNVLNLLRELSRCEYHPLSSPGYRTGEEIEQATELLNYVNSHFSQGLKLSDLAAHYGMSNSTFSRFFRRITGETFVSFIRRLRIDHACKLLLNHQLNISDICFQCGYHNLSNFNRHFLMLKHMTPREYRRLLNTSTDN